MFLLSSEIKTDNYEKGKMKITTSQLRNAIKEQVKKVLKEVSFAKRPVVPPPTGPQGRGKMYFYNPDASWYQIKRKDLGSVEALEYQYGDFDPSVDKQALDKIIKSKSRDVWMYWPFNDSGNNRQVVKVAFSQEQADADMGRDPIELDEPRDGNSNVSLFDGDNFHSLPGIRNVRQLLRAVDADSVDGDESELEQLIASGTPVFVAIDPYYADVHGSKVLMFNTDEHDAVSNFENQAQSV